MSTRVYSTDSLARALDHHVRAGRLRAWARPDAAGARKWRVEGFRIPLMVLNDRECYALVCGLASASYAAEVTS